MDEDILDLTGDDDNMDFEDWGAGEANIDVDEGGDDIQSSFPDSDGHNDDDVDAMESLLAEKEAQISTTRQVSFYTFTS